MLIAHRRRRIENVRRKKQIDREQDASARIEIAPFMQDMHDLAAAQPGEENAKQRQDKHVFPCHDRRVHDQRVGIDERAPNAVQVAHPPRDCDLIGLVTGRAPAACEMAAKGFDATRRSRRRDEEHRRTFADLHAHWSETLKVAM